VRTNIVSTRASHCAAVCKIADGTLISYYNGPECTDRQAVNLEYWIDKRVAHVRLPDKTGNSVLIPLGDNKAVLIFSIFNDTDGVEIAKHGANRWRFCTNWQTIITIIGDQIIVDDAIRFNFDNYVGHLVRCAPIKANNKWYLPTYKEHDVYGEVFTSTDGWNWTLLSRIGTNIEQQNGRFGKGILIQPTIWHHNETFYSLSRDVSDHYKAWYSESKDFGKHWSDPVSSEIDNANNSIVAIDMNIPEPLIVWNRGYNRNTLMLGKYHNKSAISIQQLNKSKASYPNYCFDNQNSLHIVHTDGIGIVRHILTKEEVASLI